VSLSTLDEVGHAFGPGSREVHDVVLRLDRYLDWFFERLLRAVGRMQVIIALTADHGVTPFPAEARAQGHDSAAAIEIDTLLASVNAGLRGAGFQFDSGMLFFRGRDQARAAGIDIDSVIAAAESRLRAVRCVDRVDRPVDLARADTAVDAIARRWVHHVPAHASVTLVVTLRPYCVWGNETYAMHGQPSELDARVPLILWGPGVQAGRRAGRVSTVDLAPTLARLIGVVPLERTDGRILLEVLGN
jgi:arylsulfatase A-like enzyme